MAPKKANATATPKRDSSSAKEAKSSSSALSTLSPAAKSAAAAKPSRIPEQLRFPALVASSLLVSYILHETAAPLTRGDLATVSARRDEWWQIGGLVVWRAAELAVGWWEGCDPIDAASLVFLTHLPYLFFLTCFYKIRPSTATVCLLIDLVALCSPFALLRDSSPVHHPKSPKRAVNNPTIINDPAIQLYTSAFATGIYAVVVFGSFGTWMPTWLVTHFEGIKDLTAIYNSQFVWLCAALLPTGFAAKTFLFTPAAGAKPDAYDKKRVAFNAETATLNETVLHNIFGHSKKVRVLAQRALTLAGMVGIHTWLHTYVAVDGAEGFGAAGWSSIWMVAALLTGLGYGWVLDIE